jgi:hypothetical protein
MASLCRVEAGEVGFLVGMRSASCSSRSGHWRADHGRGAGSERRAMVLRCCVSGENGSFGIGIGVLPGRLGILGLQVSVCTNVARNSEGWLMLTSFTLRGEYIG